ncbi:MAG: DEAD/DEAH box helicase family protein [Bacteroidota bacterium]|nr:DEAD/DEAH box helicase family protein [Bacteroidota bacterium]
MLSLSFKDGMVWLEGGAESSFVNKYFRRNPLGKWIAPAYLYQEILSCGKTKGIQIEDNAGKFFSSGELTHRETLDPFDFQKEAIEAWEKADRRGIIVLPTGAGKSFLTRLMIARLAVEETKSSALIVVPTRVLLYQWHSQLQTAFAEDVGIIGDDIFDLKPLTVTTYTSARIHMNSVGNKWKLVVFDEVHQKISEGNSSKAAVFCIAPYRLGITATPSHRTLPLLEKLIGQKVYEKSTDELIEKQVLSVYKTVHMRLTPSKEEVAAFYRLKEPMETVWQRAKEAHRVQDNKWLVRERAYYPDQVALAQRSMLHAYRYWQSLPSRLTRLEEILMKHPNDRILIFTESRATAYEISKRFLIPAITADIDSDERAFYLRAFSRGECRALVTAKALEEGIDLPEANIAVMLAGRKRKKFENISYIQRRGRVLRKRKGKEAIVYEIAFAQPKKKKGESD